MKIAIVHDYFTQLGGAERVAEQLLHFLPGADVFTTVALPECLPPGLKGVPLTTSWMQHLPLMRQYYRLYFLLYPLAVRALDLADYDLVLTSSSGYAKGVRSHRDAIHVCYCHTPMRWVWNFDSYADGEVMGSLQRRLLSRVVQGLRAWDYAAARQPDHFIANSRTVADRIQRTYGRTAEVIHPPIDLQRFRPASEQEDYYLILARLISYKRIDLAVEACSKLGRRLLVIGDGPDRARLEGLAGPSVRFLGRLSDEEVEYYVARCQALLFPGEEDFGMAPLEVAAAGRPTIAFRAGGAVETILDGETGLFFDNPTAQSLSDAITRFERQSWSKARIRRHAQRFGINVFQQRMREFLSRIGAQLPEPAAAEQKLCDDAVLV